MKEKKPLRLPCADFPNVVLRRHIFGDAHPGGLWSPNSNSAEIFVHCTYPPSFILCLLVGKLSCWQTNKQTPLSASNALRYATTSGNERCLVGQQ